MGRILYSYSLIRLASPKSEWEFLASKYEKRIHNSLLSAFEKIKNEVTQKQIINTLQLRGITGTIDLLQNMEGIIGKQILDDLQDTVRNGGRMGIGLLPKNVKDPHFNFSIIDPNTARTINNHGVRLVQEISNETRKAVLENIKANVIAGNNPIKTARDFRNTIGLTLRQEQAIRNFEQGLYTLDPQVLDRKLRDKRFDSTIERLLRGEKVSQDKIDQMVTRYRERFIKYRSQVIARTESLRGLSMGEYEALKQGYDQGKIDPDLRRFWVFTFDERTRPSHRLIPEMNKNGVRINEPFQTPLGLLLYPRDPAGKPENTIQCRCRVIYKRAEGIKPIPEPIEIKPPRPIEIRTPSAPSLNFVDKDAEVLRYHRASWDVKTIPEEIRLALEKTNPLSGGVVHDNQTPSYFSSFWKKINVSARDMSQWEEDAVWRHEYGHHLDNVMGMRAMRDEQYSGSVLAYRKGIRIDEENLVYSKRLRDSYYEDKFSLVRAIDMLGDDADKFDHIREFMAKYETGSFSPTKEWDSFVAKYKSLEIFKDPRRVAYIVQKWIEESGELTVDFLNKTIQAQPEISRKPSGVGSWFEGFFGKGKEKEFASSAIEKLSLKMKESSCPITIEELFGLCGEVPKTLLQFRQIAGMAEAITLKDGDEFLRLFRLSTSFSEKANKEHYSLLKLWDDYLASVTNSEIGTGHGKEYYRSVMRNFDGVEVAEMRTTEAYADWVSLRAWKNEKAFINQKLVKWFTPNTENAFQEITKKYLLDWGV